MLKSYVTIQYAHYPWSRGKPPTRLVEIPNGYTLEQAQRWLQEKQLIKTGEAVLQFMPNRQQIY